MKYFLLCHIDNFFNTHCSNLAYLEITVVVVNYNTIYASINLLLFALYT